MTWVSQLEPFTPNIKLSVSPKLFLIRSYWMSWSELVLFHLLGYKGQSYQITFLFIIVADGTMDQMGMETVMKTYDNISVISYNRDDCDRTEGHRWQITHWRSVQHLKIPSPITEGVSTQMTKNMFKPVRGCMRRRTQRGGNTKTPRHTTAVDNFTIKIKLNITKLYLIIIS